MENIKKQADDLLEEIGICEGKLGQFEADLATEIETITAKYRNDLDKLKAILKARVSQLNKLMKKHKVGLFTDPALASIPGPVEAIKDVRLNLKHGALLYSLEKRVKQAKKMLDRLKKHGYTDAIKIAESVNWDELEKWPDDKLAKVGTERVEKENFAYEVST
ncbi:host-nuclease inhibitor Gam family protein [bacterium]|nr:host-nuclease inhibitor Gam family protein [bacterium]